MQIFIKKSSNFDDHSMKEPAGVKSCARGRFQCRSWFYSPLFKEVVIFKNWKKNLLCKGRTPRAYLTSICIFTDIPKGRDWHIEDLLFCFYGGSKLPFMQKKCICIEIKKYLTVKYIKTEILELWSFEDPQNYFINVKHHPPPAASIPAASTSFLLPTPPISLLTYSLWQHQWNHEITQLSSYWGKQQIKSIYYNEIVVCKGSLTL